MNFDLLISNTVIAGFFVALFALLMKGIYSLFDNLR